MSEPHIVAGVDISRKYHFTEIMAMYHKGLLQPIALEGYLVRADVLDGMISFVPWHESSAARAEAGRPASAAFDVEAMREDVEREHPIVRRTPQQRKDAIAKRLAAAPHFSEAVVSEVLTESWKKGEPVTGDQIEAVAAVLMQRAENENRAADAKRVTRKHMTA